MWLATAPAAAAAPARPTRPRGRRRRSCARGQHVADQPALVADRDRDARNVSVRPTSCSSAAASSRSPFRRGAADPLPGTAPPPPRCARAGRPHTSGAALRPAPCGTAHGSARSQEPCHQRGQAGTWISAARNSTMPSSVSASRRAPGTSSSASPCSSRSTSRTAICGRRRSFDATQHAHRVALVEPRAQHVDVVPDHGRDAAGAVGQLQRQERVTVAGASPALRCTANVASTKAPSSSSDT